MRYLKGFQHVVVWQGGYGIEVNLPTFHVFKALYLTGHDVRHQMIEAHREWCGRDKTSPIAYVRT